MSGQHTRKSIAFDLDDTLHGLTETFLEFHKEKYNYSIPFEKAPESLGEILGLTDEEVNRRWDAFFQSSSWKHIKPFEGTLETLRKLGEQYDLYLMTRRLEPWIPQAQEWIDMYMPGIFKKVIYTQKVGKQKATLCKELGIEALVDDGGNNITLCKENGIRGILFDRPWNKGYSFERIRSLSELLNIL